MGSKEEKGLKIIEKSLKSVSDQQLTKLNLMVANEIVKRVEEE